MRIGKLSFALAAAALMFVLWLMRAAPVKPVAGAPSCDEDRFARIEHELSRTRVELAQLRREREAQPLAPRRDVLPASEDAFDEDENESTPQRALAADAPQDADQRADDAYNAFLTGHFERERSDPDWGSARELRGKLSGVLPQGSQLRSFACRTSLCRIETSHPDRDAYQNFAQSFSFLAGDKRVWQGAGFFHVTHAPEGPGDALLAVTFLGRDALPMIEPPR